MKTYKEELYTEIRKRLTKLSVFISFILIISLASLFMFIEKYQIIQDEKAVVAHYENVKKRSLSVLTALNNDAIPSYFKNNGNERQLYQSYYHLDNDLSSHASFLIIDNKGDIVFSTGKIAENLSPYYLKIVTEKNQKDEIIRVQRGIGGERYVLIFTKVPSMNHYSVIALNEEVFNRAPLQFDSQFIMADKFDNVFGTNSIQFIEGHMEKVNSQLLNRGFLLKNKNLYLTSSKQLDDNVFSYTFLMTFPIKVFALFSLLMTGLFLLVIMLQSKRLAERIAEKNTKEINRLVHEMKQITEGNQTAIAMETNVEFQFLVDNINKMVQEKEKLLNQQLFLERQNYAFEKKVLESQFNPHFIYNTLETIRVTSQFDIGIADKLILSLNRILRYSVDVSSGISCLGDDLSIIKDFLEVSAIRFEDFTYIIDMEESLTDLPVPKLFILPIIENALKYGMGVRNDLKITVQCYEENGNIYFAVFDNGPGFPKDMIGKIENVSEFDTHHGIINSYRRFEMIYPRSEVLINNLDEGAVVTFCLLGDKND